MLRVIRLATTSRNRPTPMVGYAQSELQSGFTMLAPQFVPVDGSGQIALDDLQPIGEDIDNDGAINIQTLNFGGVTVDTYQWIDWGDPKGWCDDTYTPVEGVTFAEGDKLLALRLAKLEAI